MNPPMTFQLVHIFSDNESDAVEKVQQIRKTLAENGAAIVDQEFEDYTIFESSDTFKDTLRIVQIFCGGHMALILIQRVEREDDLSWVYPVGLANRLSILPQVDFQTFPLQVRKSLGSF